MLEPKDRKVLNDLKQVVDSLELPMLVVGAGARLLVFDRRFGSGRSTRDWDIAVPISDWSVFDTLSDRMTQGDPPLFQPTQIRHKFIHIETRLEVDVVPFGGIGEPDQQLEWPDENTMNVMGLAEALNYASIEKVDDLELSVVNIPCFIVLKLFAWSDRRGRTNRDLEDIEFILNNFEDDDRIYEELVEELMQDVLKYTDAATYLLGIDIGKICLQPTLQQLKTILEQLILHLENIGSDSLVHKLKVLQQGIDTQAN